MSRQFEFRLEGGDFNEAREIASGADRNRDMWDVDAEDLYMFFLHSEAVDVGDFVPGFEGDNKVDAFFEADRFDAEHGGDVDDADTADFHVVACNFGAGAH